MAVHPDRPQSAHPPLSPGLLGHVGTDGVKSSPMGALGSCWDTALEGRQGFASRPLAGATVGVGCFQSESFLQSIQRETPLVVEEG